MTNIDVSTGSSDEISNLQLFGELSWLMAKSELHRNFPLWKLEQWLLPPIALQQFRLYRREKRPIAFLSFAYLSAEIEARYVEAPQSLQPSQWQSGDRLWVLDFVAPFGDMAFIVHDLRCHFFSKAVGHALRPALNSHGRRVVGFRGRDAVR